MKLYQILFSPTGGTKKVAEALVSSWNGVETIDLSHKDLTFSKTLDKDSLALVAMPSFGGVAPQLALDRLSEIQGNGCRCAVVAVYGNRAYDDTLIQMKDTAEKAGFSVIAAVSAVAEHSIIHAYASGRPDAEDRKELKNFGERILERAVTSSEGIVVPGNRPYKKAGSAMVPKASAACTSCGKCAAGCPSGAIDPKNPRQTDKNKCIGCMRCVSLCPAKARNVSPLMTKIAAVAIKKACSEPKKNELFL